MDFTHDHDRNGDGLADVQTVPPAADPTLNHPWDEESDPLDIDIDLQAVIAESVGHPTDIPARVRAEASGKSIVGNHGCSVGVDADFVREGKPSSLSNDENDANDEEQSWTMRVSPK